MILYNSENNIGDTRPVRRPLFCHRSVVKYISPILQWQSRCETWPANITEIVPPHSLAGSATGWNRTLVTRRQRMAKCEGRAWPGRKFILASHFGQYQCFGEVAWSQVIISGRSYLQGADMACALSHENKSVDGSPDPGLDCLCVQAATMPVVLSQEGRQELSRRARAITRPTT